MSLTTVAAENRKQQFPKGGGGGREGDSRGKVIVGSECLGSRNLLSGILLGFSFSAKKPLVYFLVFLFGLQWAFKVYGFFNSNVTSYQTLASTCLIILK